MTTTKLDQEVAAKRAALEKAEKDHAAAVEADRKAQEAQAKAETAYAVERSPATKKALHDARDEEEDAKVVLNVTTTALDDAKRAYEAAIAAVAAEKYTAFQQKNTPDALRVRFAPIVERIAEIRRMEIEVGKAIDAEFKALQGEYDEAGVHAVKSGLNPLKLNFSPNQLREWVVHQLRTVPVPQGTTGIHNWLDPVAGIYSVAPGAA